MEALQLISAFRVGVDNGVITCCEAFGLLEELMCVWLTFIPLTLLARLKIITKNSYSTSTSTKAKAYSLYGLTGRQSKKKFPKKKG
jgi:hypothetical protein